MLAIAVLVGMLPGTLWAQKRYKVTIDSMPQGADVYLEAKEAGSQGRTPHTFQLKKGKYTFLLEAPGFNPFSRTVEVKRSATFTFTLVAQPSPATLTINAASGSEVEGAAVKVNGKEVGKIPLTLSLQPGRYLVEVSKAGFNTFSQWRDVQRGETATLVVNLVRGLAGLGKILVASNIMGAEVFVGGRKVDTAPALVEKLEPGEHMVEVRAKGYQSQQQEVTVEAGQTKKIVFELEPDTQTLAASGGTLMILANHKEVEIFVDGQTRGMAPVKVEALEEGSHHVEARKEGMSTAEQTVEVKKGEFKTIKLALKELAPVRKTGAIRVVSPVRGAQVFIDGTLAGKTPLLRHQLDPGPHFVTVRHKGYLEAVQPVEVKAGQIAEVQADLKREPEQGASSQPALEADAEKVDVRGVASYAAHLVPTSFFSGDVSLGFPHLFEGRLTAGIFQRKHFGVDGGIEFRTYGAVSEIGLHSKLRMLRRSAFALAAMIHFGGGGGPSGRNTIYSNLGLVGSMTFKRLVTFSARTFFNLYSDRHCPGELEPDELSICGDSRVGQTLRDRDNGARFFLSAVLEIAVHRRVNLLCIIEGAPFQGGRKAYTDDFAGIMPESDSAFYGRLGATFKY